jgi:GMP synthase-like glutamine amidotransferase
MKPVAIFRHAPTEGPGYFATFLDSRGIPWRLIRVDEGDAIPREAGEFSGLAFMGGPMSVNDDLPWIPLSLALIRDAVEKDIAVLGHCLGGQLMAKALGGAVSKNPVKEIGWGEVTVADHPIARDWFGGQGRFEVFHWHGETFTLPPGAVRILSSPYCENQAFALGKHLGMQCHVEMTEEMVRTWGEGGRDEIEGARSSPAVQTVDQMREDLARRVKALNAVAEKIYRRWAEGVSGA